MDRGEEKLIDVCGTLVWKQPAMRKLGKLRRNWEDNMKMDLRKTGFVDVSWMDLTQSYLVVSLDAKC
jgi:hypothetical protein